MPAGLILLGQFLGPALACGLNLYLTVAALGLAGRFGLLELPLGLRGLESTVVVATALILYAMEAVADKVPYLDSLWDAVHTLIRPPAAALLALGALSGQPLEIQAAGAAIAGAAALAAHGVKSGLRLSLYTSARRVPIVRISVAEDVLALLLVVAVFVHPTAATALVAASILAVAVAGPTLSRAFILGIRAFIARGRSYLAAPGWSSPHELPASLRAFFEDKLAAAPPRAARAALSGPGSIGAFRNGWFAVTHQGPMFLYRSFLRPRSLPLGRARYQDSRAGELADALEIQTDAGVFTLLLLKDGPGADEAAAELAGTPAVSA